MQRYSAVPLNIRMSLQIGYIDICVHGEHFAEGLWKTHGLTVDVLCSELGKTRTNPL